MMNPIDRGYRQANAIANVVFQERVEPVICWLDADWPARKQMRRIGRECSQRAANAQPTAHVMRVNLPVTK